MQRLCLQPSENPSRNVTFSPLNVSIALTFLLLGAHSTPLTEILGGLKFSLTATPKADIRRGFRHLPRSLRPPSCSLHLSRGSAMFMDEQLKLLGEFGMKARRRPSTSEPFPTDFRNYTPAEKLINDCEGETPGEYCGVGQPR